MSNEIMGESFDNFNFNAPQFFDFSQNHTDLDEVDEYFEMDHESNKDPLGGEVANSPSSHEENCRIGAYFIRRSMSVGDLNYLRALDEPAISEDIECIESPVTNLRKVGSYASLNGYGQESKENKVIFSRSSKTMSRESIDRLAQPKQRQFSSNQELHRNNYVPVAEYINKYQNATPERFRRKPKPDEASRLHPKMKTIPKSPHLISTKRNRPLNVLSQEQQEKRDFEEAQKFKIKAHPVNKRILHGPLRTTVQVAKKPSTVPQPFRLTAPAKKEPASPDRVQHHEFRARPVPRSLHESPQMTAPRLPVTEPVTPSFMKRCAKEAAKPPAAVEEKPHARPRTTAVLPFSFEMRDMCLRQKREQLLEKVKEEERKAREFHARPAPKAVLLNGSKNSSSAGKQASFRRCDSQRSLTGSDGGGSAKGGDSTICQFKARPATVLAKEPFVPKKTDRPLTEVQQFSLSTETRARNREAYDRFVKEREDRLAMHKMMEEMRRMQEEEEEKAKLRKLTEYKAQPIKKYKEITIQPSGKVTEPVSPTFLTDKFHPPKNRRDDKENVRSD